MKCPYCQKEMEEGYILFNSPFVLKSVSLIDKHKIRISDKLKLSEVAKIKIYIIAKIAIMYLLRKSKFLGTFNSCH